MAVCNAASAGADMHNIKGVRAVVAASQNLRLELTGTARKGRRVKGWCASLPLAVRPERKPREAKIFDVSR